MAQQFQFTSELDTKGVATKSETQEVQGEERVQDSIVEDILARINKGKEIQTEEVEEESSDSSGSHRSDFDEEPQETVHKIFVD